MNRDILKPLKKHYENLERSQTENIRLNDLYENIIITRQHNLADLTFF